MGMALLFTIGITLSGAVLPVHAGGERHKVTFDANGGTAEAVPKTVLVEHNQGIDEDGLKEQSIPKPPKRTGYNFVGWATDKLLQGPDFYGTTPVDRDLTVYALWEKASETIPVLTVTFDKNGGDTEAEPRIVHVQKDMGIGTDSLTDENMPEILPTRKGYVFRGWGFRKDDPRADFVAHTAVAKNMTVYAQWAPEKPAVAVYTITFDKNGGDTEAEPRTVRVQAGCGIGTDALTEENMPTVLPTRKGYSFRGWGFRKKDERADFTAHSVVTGDTTVYAQWVKAEKNRMPLTGMPGNMLTEAIMMAISAVGGGLTIGRKKRRSM